MEAITRDLRVNIFKEGLFLRANQLKAPSGDVLDASLNDIQKVKKTSNRKNTTTIISTS